MATSLACSHGNPCILLNSPDLAPTAHLLLVLPSPPHSVAMMKPARQALPLTAPAAVAAAAAGAR